MVRPIPLHLLKDSVTYEEYDSKSRFDDTWKPPVSLRNVRIQEMSSMSISTIRDHSAFKLLMFYDVVNSKSDNAFNFVEKSKVTYKENVYVVNKVTAVEAFKLHHYEVELS